MNSGLMSRKQSVFERLITDMNGDTMPSGDHQRPHTRSNVVGVDRITPVHKPSPHSKTVETTSPNSGGDARSGKGKNNAVVEIISAPRSSQVTSDPQKTPAAVREPGNPDLCPFTLEANITRWPVLAEAMDPLMYLFCIYGVMPLAFRPVRISVHPFRSTLIYTIAVFCVVTWSVCETIVDRTSILLSDVCMDERMMAMQALAHVTAHIFVPIAWMEASVFRDRPEKWNEFAATYGHLVCRRLPSKTLCKARTMTFIVLVFTPITVVAGLLAIPQIGAQSEHILAHTHVTCVCFLICTMFCVGCRAINDLATDAAKRLQQMVIQNRATADSVAEFRSCWLSLRELLSTAGGLSVGALLFLLYLLVLITLSSYQFMAALASAHWVIAACVSGVGTLYCIQLLVMCDYAHRATATMQLTFAAPLTSLNVSTLDPDLRCEVQHFLSTLIVTPAGVWVAGFLQVNRQLMGSMMAAMVTYLVVLLQFRQSDEKVECKMVNSTLLATLD